MTGPRLTTRRTAAGLRRPALLLAAIVTAVVLAGCSVFAYDPTPLPAESPSSSPTTGGQSTPARCDNALASYAPTGDQPAPGSMPSGSTMAKIAERGRLIAGVSADTYLLGSRNPLNGQIEGFDIDMVKAISKAIFGDENRYQLRVITAADRIPVLEDGEVDIVVRNMTITCDRWTQIAFSSEYYRSGQKILVRRGSDAKTLADLKGQRVCAPNGTSSMDNLIARNPDAIAVGATNHTACLVLFQEGAVDAITGDDTVLAGLAAQDPYAVVLDGDPLTAEPYGIGVNADQVDLVRFVNGHLAGMRTDGEWTRIYNRWLAGSLGKAPAPPKAVYGRNP